MVRDEPQKFFNANIYRTKFLGREKFSNYSIFYFTILLMLRVPSVVSVWALLVVTEVTHLQSKKAPCKAETLAAKRKKYISDVKWVTCWNAVHKHAVTFNQWRIVIVIWLNPVPMHKTKFINKCVEFLSSKPILLLWCFTSNSNSTFLSIFLCLS